MPNGGYPLHLSVLLNDLELVLGVTGTDVTLWQVTQVERHGRREEESEQVAVFTETQVNALLFHLAYWHCGGNRRVMDFLAANGLDVRPADLSPGCRYAY